MRMNRVETLVLNSPVRALVQRKFEVPLLRRLGAQFQGARVLEVGCGRGVGAQLMLHELGAAHVTAIDLDPAQVGRARRRLAGMGRADVALGDASDLDAPDGSVDVVVDSAVFHHVPVWQDAVREAVRVLRPGGQFVFSEVTAHALARPTYRALFEHPKDNRFTATQFRAELERCGLRLLTTPRELVFGDFVLGVAVKEQT